MKPMLAEFKEGVLAKFDADIEAWKASDEAKRLRPSQYLLKWEEIKRWRTNIEMFLDMQIAEPDFAGADTLSVDFLRKLDNAHRILEGTN